MKPTTCCHRTELGLVVGIAKQWDPDQTPRSAASDQGLRYLLKLQEVKGEMKQS